ncbi:YheC/YheD family endospore coat-associated protein [Chengkuizengella axinellae]|uniref:YheC/YheD family protein n=1 Tax=Chengkuizengella axinellae TaxID=3064388 RepID=A0ABT9IYL1_9BACL|nr:YheC/YheD family protein [Chengkuizengella sp. 2205SS18-9]MDP5274398.1 YheC/YheD family protein [Chengkuizengella sp. 2205SS18-9]
MNSHTMGIMVTDLNTATSNKDQTFYKNLCKFGQKLKITIFIFAINQINWEENLVVGAIYTKNEKWIKKFYSIPSLIYDRCFFKTKEQYLLYRTQLKKLFMLQKVQFLGNRLMDKWSVFHVLKSEPFMKKYLPKTELYHNPWKLQQTFLNQKQFILKPISGSQGKGILHVEKQIHMKNDQEKSSNQESYVVKGRDKKNNCINITYNDFRSFVKHIQSFIHNRKYIIQEYLHLKTTSNTTFDIRALVQKNGSGEWQFTGMGVRCGQDGSLTSNLHGGGFVKEVHPFLIKEYGEESAFNMIQEINEINRKLPHILENHFGRLSELGIDFGIDLSGNIWFLEANSKPGRSIFNSFKDSSLKKTSVQLPIYYAQYLLKQQLGG